VDGLQEQKVTMAIKKFIYISGPRMGTNNQNSGGPVISKAPKKKKKKK
jgi:hypothetical protein